VHPSVLPELNALSGVGPKHIPRVRVHAYFTSTQLVKIVVSCGASCLSLSVAEVDTGTAVPDQQGTPVTKQMLDVLENILACPSGFCSTAVSVALCKCPAARGNKHPTTIQHS
jgi:hypothetical protein